MTLTVAIAALNEEDNLYPTYKTVVDTVERYFDDFEILIFNDGSTDRTEIVAYSISRNDYRVTAINHLTPHNLGVIFAEGIALAKMEYFILIMGDNDMSKQALENIFNLCGQADLIIPYHTNPEIRPLIRRGLSKLFVWLVNRITGNHLKYYNGTVLHRTRLLERVLIESKGFGYQAEAITKLLRIGRTYKEVGIKLQDRQRGKSKALRWKNIVSVIKTLRRLR